MIALPDLHLPDCPRNHTTPPLAKPAAVLDPDRPDCYDPPDDPLDTPAGWLFVADHCPAHGWSKGTWHGTAETRPGMAEGGICKTRLACYDDICGPGYRAHSHACGYPYDRTRLYETPYPTGADTVICETSR